MNLQCPLLPLASLSRQHFPLSLLGWVARALDVPQANTMATQHFRLSLQYSWGLGSSGIVQYQRVVWYWCFSMSVPSSRIKMPYQKLCNFPQDQRLQKQWLLQSCHELQRRGPTRSISWQQWQWPDLLGGRYASSFISVSFNSHCSWWPSSHFCTHNPYRYYSHQWPEVS